MVKKGWFYTFLRYFQKIFEWEGSDQGSEQGSYSDSLHRKRQLRPGSDQGSDQGSDFHYPEIATWRSGSDIFGKSLSPETNAQTTLAK